MTDKNYENSLDQAEVIDYITGTFDDVHVVTSEGNSFFFSGPADNESNKFPFATLVTNDAYDHVSRLNRPNVYRLNLGISKATFLELFGSQVPRPGPDGIIETEYDYSALDKIIPHPVYGNMYWICVLNPSPATFQQVRSLVAEAYKLMTQKQKKRIASG